MITAQFHSPATCVLRADDTIAAAIVAFMTTRAHALPVVDADQRLLGILRLDGLLKLLLPKAAALGGMTDLSFVSDTLADIRQRYAGIAGEPIAAHVQRPDHPIHPDTPLAEVLMLLERGDCELPVCERGSGRLLGVVSAIHVLELVTRRD